jgi:hypothetical protein
MGDVAGVRVRRSRPVDGLGQHVGGGCAWIFEVCGHDVANEPAGVPGRPVPATVSQPRRRSRAISDDHEGREDCVGVLVRVDSRTGALLWQLALVPIGDEFMREAITVTVDSELKAAPGEFVEVENLVASTWETEGRWGVAFGSAEPSAAVTADQPTLRAGRFLRAARIARARPVLGFGVDLGAELRVAGVVSQRCVPVR